MDAAHGLQRQRAGGHLSRKKSVVMHRLARESAARRAGRAGCWALHSVASEGTQRAQCLSQRLARASAPASSTPPALACSGRCFSRAPPTRRNNAESGGKHCSNMGLACLQRKLVAAHAPKVLQPLQHTGKQLPRRPGGTGRTSTPSARDGSPPWRTPPPCAGGGRSPCRARHAAAAWVASRDRT